MNKNKQKLIKIEIRPCAQCGHEVRIFHYFHEYDVQNIYIEPCAFCNRLGTLD